MGVVVLILKNIPRMVYILHKFMIDLVCKRYLQRNMYLNFGSKPICFLRLLDWDGFVCTGGISQKFSDGVPTKCKVKCL